LNLEKSYVAVLTKDSDDFVLVSDHPAIGILHWPHQDTLERSVRSAMERIDDDIVLRYGPGLTPMDEEPDEALRADKPDSAYETVPGTERLPATARRDPGDGLDAVDDDERSDLVRKTHREHVRVVALGQVHAPR